MRSVTPHAEYPAFFVYGRGAVEGRQGSQPERTSRIRHALRRFQSREQIPRRIELEIPIIRRRVQVVRERQPGFVTEDAGYPKCSMYFPIERMKDIPPCHPLRNVPEKNSSECSRHLHCHMFRLPKDSFPT